MVKPILRLKNGIVLSAEMDKTLGILLPNYETQYFDDKPGYQESIKERINSLYNAFVFVLDSCPADPAKSYISKATWKTFALKRKELYELKATSFDEMYKELQEFTDDMVRLLTLYLPLADNDKNKLAQEAVETLNEAEEYFLLSKERPHVATLIRNPEYPNKFILQLDKAISSNNDTFTKELELIKEQQFPKTPLWLQNLPVYQQTFFCNLGKEIKSLTDLKKDYLEFLDKWLAYARPRFWDGILKLIHEESGPPPDWYNVLKPCYKSLVRELSADPSTCDRKVSDLKDFLENADLNIDDKFFEQVSKIHEWYWVLPLRQQYFLEHVIQDKVKQSVSLNIPLYPPSRLRRVPLVTNSRQHLTFTVTIKGILELLGGDNRNGSAHPASRETLGKSQLVQKYIATSNFEQIIAGISPVDDMKSAQAPSKRLLMQTLISDLWMLDYVPTVLNDAIKTKLPDNALADILRKVIYASKYNKRVFQHNHPVNGYANYVDPTKSDNLDSKSLIEAFTPDSKGNKELKDLIAEYQRVLKYTPSSTQLSDGGRELFLSALEQLIFFQTGDSVHGTCMSGKDREAILLIYIDAMLHNKNIYGAWPRFGVPIESIERKNFAKLFAHLYVTRHQHVMASLNAPGAKGIQTVERYLPSDICEAIKNLAGSDVLTRDDAIATTNEVKKIVTLTNDTYKDNLFLCHLVALEIGEEKCKTLFTTLYGLLNEKEKFPTTAPKTTTYGLVLNFFKQYLIPNKGYEEVLKVLDGSGLSQKNANVSNIDALSNCCALILTHCAPNKDASKMSNRGSNNMDYPSRVYASVTSLIMPTQNSGDCSSRAEAADQTWTELFEKSKQMNQSKSAGV